MRAFYCEFSAVMAIALCCAALPSADAQGTLVTVAPAAPGELQALPTLVARAMAIEALPTPSSSIDPAGDLPDDPSALDQSQVPADVKQPTGDRATQTKRVLGIMPNFSSVSADEKLAPLSPEAKFILAGKNTFDYSSFFIAAIQAGFAMNSDSYPEFHQGVAGYGRYYWHTLADTADENFLVGGLFPVVFRQDPRFYTLGHGSAGHRVLYAASRVILSRSDAGHEVPNFAEIVGAGAAAGVSSLYYPSHDRTWTKVGQKWLTSSLIDSANFTFKEFWPNINHKLFHTH